MEIKRPNQQPTNSTPTPAPKKKMNGCLKVFLIGLGILIILRIISSIFGGNNDTSDTINTKTEAVSTNEEVKEIESPKIDSAKIKELSKLFTEKKDDFKGYSWVKPKVAPQYLSQNGFYCYFNKEGNEVYNFRFVGQYYSDDWLFVKKLIFNVDGKNYDYYPEKIDRDNGSGNIWEWYDDSINASKVQLIKAIANAKVVKIRWEGKTYYDDKQMSSNYIKSIKNTLEYYEALGGKF